MSYERVTFVAHIEFPMGVWILATIVVGWFCSALSLALSAGVGQHCHQCCRLALAELVRQASRRAFENNELLGCIGGGHVRTHSDGGGGGWVCLCTHLCCCYPYQYYDYYYYYYYYYYYCCVGYSTTITIVTCELHLGTVSARY